MSYQIGQDVLQFLKYFVHTTQECRYRAFFFFELRTVFMGLNGISPPLHMKGPARRGEAGSRGARSSRARGGGLVLTPKRRSHS